MGRHHPFVAQRRSIHLNMFLLYITDYMSMASYEIIFQYVRKPKEKTLSGSPTGFILAVIDDRYVRTLKDPSTSYNKGPSKNLCSSQSLSRPTCVEPAAFFISLILTFDREHEKVSFLNDMYSYVILVTYIFKTITTAFQPASP